MKCDTSTFRYYKNENFQQIAIFCRKYLRTLKARDIFEHLLVTYIHQKYV